jgi:hypothetical protein
MQLQSQPRLQHSTGAGSSGVGWSAGVSSVISFGASSGTTSGSATASTEDAPAATDHVEEPPTPEPAAEAPAPAPVEEAPDLWQRGHLQSLLPLQREVPRELRELAQRQAQERVLLNLPLSPLPNLPLSPLPNQLLNPLLNLPLSLFPPLHDLWQRGHLQSLLPLQREVPRELRELAQRQAQLNPLLNLPLSLFPNLLLNPLLSLPLSQFPKLPRLLPPGQEQVPQPLVPG